LKGLEKRWGLKGGKDENSKEKENTGSRKECESAIEDTTVGKRELQEN
jgi:hypothetical protein